jgi:hypothetical protein
MIETSNRYLYFIIRILEVYCIVLNLFICFRVETLTLARLADQFLSLFYGLFVRRQSSF